MVELIQANLYVHHEAPNRCYTAHLRWSNGAQQSVVLFEREVPKMCGRLQEVMDAVKGMTVSERLAYIDKNLRITGIE